MKLYGYYDLKLKYILHQKGVMSLLKLDGNMSNKKLKSLAVQLQNQREEVNGSKSGIKWVTIMPFPINFLN